MSIRNRQSPLRSSPGARGCAGCAGCAKDLVPRLARRLSLSFSLTRSSVRVRGP